MHDVPPLRFEAGRALQRADLDSRDARELPRMQFQLRAKGQRGEDRGPRHTKKFRGKRLHVLSY